MTDENATGEPVTDPETLGGRLHDAFRAGEVLDLPAEETQALTVEDAYQAQHASIRERTAAGAARAGYKIGFTNESVQTQFGIDEPAYGVLTDDTIVTDGQIDTAGLVEPKVEPELAFRIGERLAGPVTPDAVLAATDAVVPAIEVVDSRLGAWDIDATAAIADNALAARFCPGTAAADPLDVDLGMEAVQVRIDGTLVDTGVGADVLGHPAEAVAWLAGALPAHDDALEPGDVVTTGSMTPALSIGTGDVVEARFASLGTVTMRAE